MRIGGKFVEPKYVASVSVLLGASFVAIGVWRMMAADPEQAMRRAVGAVYSHDWQTLYDSIDQVQLERTGITKDNFPKFCESFFALVPRNAEPPKLLFAQPPANIPLDQAPFDPRNERRAEVHFPRDIQAHIDVPSMIIERSDTNHKWISDGFALMIAVFRGYGTRAQRVHTLAEAMIACGLEKFEWSDARMGTTLARLKQEETKPEADIRLMIRTDLKSN